MLVAEYNMNFYDIWGGRYGHPMQGTDRAAPASTDRPLTTSAAETT